MSTEHESQNRMGTCAPVSLVLPKGSQERHKTPLGRRNRRPTQVKGDVLNRTGNWGHKCGSTPDDAITGPAPSCEAQRISQTNIKYKQSATELATSAGDPKHDAVTNLDALAADPKHPAIEIEANRKLWQPGWRKAPDT